MKALLIRFVSGETSGGASFPLHGRSLKVLLLQQRGGKRQKNHILLKKIRNDHCQHCFNTILNSTGASIGEDDWTSAEQIQRHVAKNR